MADPVLLTDADVWLGGYALDGSVNNLDLRATKAEKPNSRLGDTAETFFPGLAAIDGKVSGFYSAGVGEPDAILHPRVLNDSSEWPLTINPPYAPAASPGADGNIGYTVRTAQFYLSFGGPHGELLPYELTSKTRAGNLYRQTIVLPRATYAATTTGVGRQLGLVSATQKLVATLHVFALTGGSWVVTVESDDNAGFTSATTRLTLTAVTTAPNRLVAELVGPIAVDDYWRVVLTKTGGTSINAAVLLSIEPQP
jgi:hypothetical protein